MRKYKFKKMEKAATFLVINLLYVNNFNLIALHFWYQEYKLIIISL